MPKEAELLLVLGGDGSILHAAPFAIRLDIPILGINLGRLGYFNELEVEDIPKLSHLFDDTYAIKNRMTLQIDIVGNAGKTEQYTDVALNDVVFHTAGRLADMALSTSMGETLHYRADGLIVATPSGSTAYSLSAGGPVIDDNISTLCVTPICPRSFFARSILFEEKETLFLRTTAIDAPPVFVTVDGRAFREIAHGETVCVKKSPKPLKMVTLSYKNMLSLLQKKMNMQNF